MMHPFYFMDVFADSFIVLLDAVQNMIWSNSSVISYSYYIIIVFGLFFIIRGFLYD